MRRTDRPFPDIDPAAQWVRVRSGLLYTRIAGRKVDAYPVALIHGFVIASDYQIIAECAVRHPSVVVLQGPTIDARVFARCSWGAFRWAALACCSKPAATERAHRCAGARALPGRAGFDP